MTKKERLMGTSIEGCSKIVLGISLPDGAKEIIVSDNLVSKLQYLNTAYDGYLHLKANPAIQILDWMVI
jgi:hypothetical protein